MQFDMNDSDISNSDISEYKVKINGHRYKKWSQQQNFLYISYLEQNFTNLKDPRKRKPRKFFTKMADHLNGTRNNEQCRTHHQKMLKSHHSVLGIIKHFREFRKIKEEYESENTIEELPLPSSESQISMKIILTENLCLETHMIQIQEEIFEKKTTSLLDEILQEFDQEELCLMY